MSEQRRFENALAELEAVVEQLQHPDVPLDDAVRLYRRGTELAAQTEQLLSEAEVQVQQLTQAVRERFEEYATDEAAAGDHATDEDGSAESGPV